jgi:hypothetical protein
LGEGEAACLSEEALVGYIAPEGKTKVVKGSEGGFMKQESGELVGEHMVKMMCPQRLARTDSLSSCLSMWAPILLGQLRSQRLLRFSNKHIDQDTYH